MKLVPLVCGSVFAAAALLLSPSEDGLFSMGEAQAQLIIRNPSDHPDYRVELEPHGTFIFWRTHAYGRNRGAFVDDGRYGIEAGAGFRATIEIVDPVIPRLNNTIGITFGIDVTNCEYCNPTYVGDKFSIWTPIGAQWNFFLTRRWSVFAEIGGVLRSDGWYREIYGDPMFELGGRFHFRDKITLTMRLGIPWVTVGVSFMVP